MKLILDTDDPKPFSFDYEKMAEKAIETVALEEEFPYDIMVSLTLVDEEEIHRINLEQREIDAPTDVLSFPMIDFSKPRDYGILEEDDSLFDPDEGLCVLGDIVLCIERIRAQAAEYGHSELREYVFLIVHSMLHLLGYDHIEEDERLQMEERQRQIMLKLGILR